MTPLHGSALPAGAADVFARLMGLRVVHPTAVEMNDPLVYAGDHALGVRLTLMLTFEDEEGAAAVQAAWPKGFVLLVKR